MEVVWASLVPRPSSLTISPFLEEKKKIRRKKGKVKRKRKKAKKKKSSSTFFPPSFFSMREKERVRQEGLGTRLGLGRVTSQLMAISQFYTSSIEHNWHPKIEYYSCQAIRQANIHTYMPLKRASYTYVASRSTQNGILINHPSKQL